MAWWYIIAAAILYFIFKDKINTKIKEIQKWLKLNSDILEKWKNNSEIVAAYENLQTVFNAAKMDAHWTPTEILLVLNAALKLFNLIKKFEEKEVKNE